MEGWSDGGMEGWMHACLDACILGCKHAWIHACLDACMDENLVLVMNIHACMHMHEFSSLAPNFQRHLKHYA